MTEQADGWTDAHVVGRKIDGTFLVEHGTGNITNFGAVDDKPSDTSQYGSYNLRNKPEAMTRWINVYPSAVGGHHRTRERANAIGGVRLALVELRVEGEKVTTIIHKG